MGIGPEKGMEEQIVFQKQFAQNLRVKGAEIEDAKLAAQALHVFDNLKGLCFPQGEVVFLKTGLPDEVDKSVDRKGIVLGGNGKVRARRFGMKIAVSSSCACSTTWRA
jgi:hypothetical protein